jgi:aminoglycoside phosphotransferase (APT) family kinase protein
MSARDVGPAAAGVRLPYDGLPAHVRSWVEHTLGSPVASAVTQPGGFSPGVAARLRCADGRRAFVKAVSADANPDSPQMHRREAEVLRALPDELPVPRLLASYDEEPWVALLVEDVAGRQPTLPWRDDELDRMLAVTRLVSEQRGVPVRPAREHVERWQGWRRLAEAGGGPADVERLAELEAAAPECVDGDHLLHVDVRADNVLLDGDRTWLVDWPWAARGPRWLDAVASAPAVAMQGGPEPQAYVDRSRLVHPGDDEAVTCVLAAFAGMLTLLASLPPPPGLPTVRAFQAAQADIATAWLRTRLGPPRRTPRR